MEIDWTLFDELFILESETPGTRHKYPLEYNQNLKTHLNLTRCGMYPDMEKSTTFTIIHGVAPINNYEMVEEKAGGNGCKCGSNCTCDPCNC
ncbi:hypothetical protein H5410_023305 [Solanum commersonii]|uniref:Metallothionein-like protein n=1 Tax=Solanum commersonii TaxID=4109 RepID=A0A9J5ZJ35_SOLCO|nr:hypothetical protein H5410_023305 [Solanum commersonii]